MADAAADSEVAPAAEAAHAYPEASDAQPSNEDSHSGADEAEETGPSEAEPSPQAESSEQAEHEASPPVDNDEQDSGEPALPAADETGDYTADHAAAAIAPPPEVAAAPPLPVAAAVEGVPRVASTSRPSLPPPLPGALQPQVAAASLPPPAPFAKSSAPGPGGFSPAELGARISVLQARVVSAVPPRWIEVARQYPALWMAAAPAGLALMFIGLVAAVQPPARPSPARVAVTVASAVPAPTPSVAAPPAVEPAPEQKPAVSLAALESKAPESLTIDELLLLREARAQHKREDVQALARKLAEQADLAKDTAVQAQLLRFASDPDTAAEALRAMASMKSPVGPDLLYEVLSARPAPGTVELARSLLNSSEVRPAASAALGVALELASNSCEAVLAALPRAKEEGDRRSLPALSRLNSHRGCGADKDEDCFPCVRSQPKLLRATIETVKKRRAPTYPAR